jgi:hypothetical protein
LLQHFSPPSVTHLIDLNALLTSFFSLRIKVLRQMRATHTRLFYLALLFLGLAGITWLLLEIAIRGEIAQSPGQDSLGVAALGMLFGFPILAFLGFGAVALVGSAIAFLRGFIASRKNAK